MDSVFGRLLYYFLVGSTSISYCPVFGFDHFSFPSISDFKNFGAVQDSILNHADNPKQSTEYKEFVHAKIYAAFDEFNNELQFYQHKTSALAWNISFDMSPEILGKTEFYVCEFMVVNVRCIWTNSSLIANCN